ncbi:MAG: hypothetical protein GF383_06160 [Candidatus Lokiarchaeota archaeon]|nr:hypothetical protein [Candidatus Lokiarchaeota archaeon]MBD3339536.1 hypothetical protein [Candidatus Lokiarchaeota archaeon]
MEIIATGELREYFKSHLPEFDDPVIYISSEFIPGCPKCNSSTAVYYIKLKERADLAINSNTVKAKNHRFPVDIYVKYTILKGKPKQIVIGSKRSGGKLQMVLRRII